MKRQDLERCITVRSFLRAQRISTTAGEFSGRSRGRATRTTELVERFPAHVATAWLGHSPEIARKHYLSVTEGHFDRVAQKAAQQKRKMPKTAPNDHGGGMRKTDFPGGCKDMHESAHNAGGGRGI